MLWLIYHQIRVEEGTFRIPFLRGDWINRCHEEWRTFLDEAYWNVELSDDVVPRVDD